MTMNEKQKGLYEGRGFDFLDYQPFFSIKHTMVFSHTEVLLEVSRAIMDVNWNNPDRHIRQ